MPLTPKQSRFVDEYMVDFNATRAAVRAGYSAKTAQPASSRLLSKVMISEEVGRRKEELAKQVPPERIVRELARIGFANIGDYMRQVGDNDLRFFADRAAKKWPLRGSLELGVGCL